MIVILVIALIFLGPERLPEAARTLGTWVRDIRRMSSEAMGIWQETLGVGDEIRQTVNPRNLIAPVAPPPGPPGAPAAIPPPAAVPLSVPYTPPISARTNGDAAEPAVLMYPAPFEGPPPPEPPKLWYPAPFEQAEESE